MEVTPAPVKRRAVEADIEVMQFETLRTPPAPKVLAAKGADVFVVAAYGLILPPEVLRIPEAGCVNVHFSLLPKLRGAAPVQWAIIEGYETTGVTVMLMDEEMDTGDVLTRAPEPVRLQDTAGTLVQRLSSRGAALLVETLDRLESGEVTPEPQDDSQATSAPMLTTEDARIDWRLPAVDVERRIRAFDPRPGAWTLREDRRLKVWRARVLEGKHPPGEIDLSMRESLVVGCGKGLLVLEEVQPEGRSRMSGAEFVRGYHPRHGEVLG
jgi:methionyl-tRNA formyltransferase